jgi:pre-mRNA-splicing factor SYF1
LWCALADYYIRQGLFERARDVYQEGVESVITVRDFTLIFEALTSFEQALIEAQMEQLGEDMPEEAGIPEGDGADFLLTDDKGDIDLRLERLEWLYSERPKLLNSVMLRQNPHNVAVCSLATCISFVLSVSC